MGGLRRVASVQMAVVEAQPDVNRAALAAWMDAEPGVDLFLAPELWTSGYAHEDWPDLADADTPVTLSWLAEQARRRNAWLGGSVIARHASGALVNRFVLFDRAGHQIGHYDKAHLFGPLAEDRHMRAGERVPVFDVEGVRVAPAICYDLRFPEQFRRQALSGIDLFLVSSEWPHPRERILRTLAEARAIENQAFLLLANRVGPSALGLEFCGESGLFGPFGLVHGLQGPEEGLVSVELEPELLHQARTALPIWEQRMRGVDFE